MSLSSVPWWPELKTHTFLTSCPHILWLLHEVRMWLSHLQQKFHFNFQSKDEPPRPKSLEDNPLNWFLVCFCAIVNCLDLFLWKYCNKNCNSFIKESHGHSQCQFTVNLLTKGKILQLFYDNLLTAWWHLWSFIGKIMQTSRNSEMEILISQLVWFTKLFTLKKCLFL